MDTYALSAIRFISIPWVDMMPKFSITKEKEKHEGTIKQPPKKRLIILNKS